MTMARKLESGWLMSAGTESNSFTRPASMTSTYKCIAELVNSVSLWVFRYWKYPRRMLFSYKLIVKLQPACFTSSTLVLSRMVLMR